MSQLSQEFPHVSHVVVELLGEVVVHQGAVESSAAHTDHHRGQAHEQQDEAGVLAHHICKRRTDSRLQLNAAASTCAPRRLSHVPCSAPSSGSVKRTLRLELSLAELLQELLPVLLQLGGGRPSREALLRFRMDTRLSGPEACGKTQDQELTDDGENEEGGEEETEEI